MRAVMHSRWYALVAVLLLVVSVSAFTHPIPGRYADNEIVCKPDSGVSIEQINGKYGTSNKASLAPLNCFLLQVPQGNDVDSLAGEINRSGLAAYCSPNYLLSIPEALQRSSPFVDMQLIGDYDLQPAAVTLALAAVHDLSEGRGTSVAILDGGINSDHPEFLASSADIISEWDYVDNDPFAFDEPGGSCSGHGTLVAGVVHLVAPEASLHAYRVLDTAGCGDGFSIAAAVLRAVADSCDIINLSLGMIGIHDALDEALKYARACGLTTIAAAGNDSTDSVDSFPFPASQPYCLSVAAVDSNSVKADFSNFGSLVRLCAPGTQVYGPFVGDSYAWWDGTSFAAPFVTGLAALVMASHEQLQPLQVESILATSAAGIDHLNPAYAGQLGAGLLSPLAAITTARTARHGDVNLDGTVTPVDLAHLVDYFFNQPADGEMAVSVWADCNCDGIVDPVDLSAMLDFFYVAAEPGCVEP